MDLCCDFLEWSILVYHGNCLFEVSNRFDEWDPLKGLVMFRLIVVS